VSFTATGARATLSRGGDVYATGSLAGGKLTVGASKLLRLGHYALILTAGTGSQRHTTGEPVSVGETVTIA
jgi:hypothetical protein